MKICLERNYGPEQTLGNFYVYDDDGKLLLHLKTMELAWRDNQRRVSCIPEGTYTAKRHTSPKFGPSFWVQDVPERSEILFHPANYSSQLLGCIAPGLKNADINADGLMDVTSSRAAMKKMLEILPDEFEFTISNAKQV